MCRVSGFVPKSGRRVGEKTVLTRKQTELLLLINKRLNDGGVSPSFDEMKDALGLRSKSGIHRLITGLEERGFLKRLAHRARALEVVKLPEATAVRDKGERPAPPGASAGVGSGTGFSPKVIHGDFAGALPGAAVANDA